MSLLDDLELMWGSPVQLPELPANLGAGVACCFGGGIFSITSGAFQTIWALGLERLNAERPKLEYYYLVGDQTRIVKFWLRLSLCVLGPVWALSSEMLRVLAFGLALGTRPSKLLLPNPDPDLDSVEAYLADYIFSEGPVAERRKSWSAALFMGLDALFKVLGVAVAHRFEQPVSAVLSAMYGSGCVRKAFVLWKPRWKWTGYAVGWGVAACGLAYQWKREFKPRELMYLVKTESFLAALLADLLAAASSSA